MTPAAEEKSCKSCRTRGKYQMIDTSVRYNGQGCDRPAAERNKSRGWAHVAKHTDTYMCPLQGTRHQHSEHGPKGGSGTCVIACSRQYRRISAHKTLQTLMLPQLSASCRMHRNGSRNKRIQSAPAATSYCSHCMLQQWTHGCGKVST